jgi:condensin complex subunit 1
MMSSKPPSSSFPIPSSLQDLERAPYNLIPYPHDFEDDDEAARADSFDALVTLVEQGNRTLVNGSLVLFQDEEGDDPWNDQERIQALYTLVRFVSVSCFVRYIKRRMLTPSLFSRNQKIAFSCTKHQS